MSCFDPAVVGPMPLLQPAFAGGTPYTLSSFAVAPDGSSGTYNVSPSFTMRNVGSWLNKSHRCGSDGNATAQWYATLSSSASAWQVMTPDAETAMVFRLLLMPTNDPMLENDNTDGPWIANGTLPSVWGNGYIMQLQAKQLSDSTWYWINAAYYSHDNYFDNTKFTLSDSLESAWQPSRWGLVSATQSNLQDPIALGNTPLAAGAVLLVFQNYATLKSLTGDLGFPATIYPTSNNLVVVSAAKTFKNPDDKPDGYGYAALYPPTDIDGGAGGNCQTAVIAQHCSINGVNFCAKLPSPVAVDTPQSGNIYFTYDLWLLQPLVGSVAGHEYNPSKPAPPLIAGGGGNVTPSGGGGGTPSPPPPPPPPPVHPPSPPTSKGGLPIGAIIGIVVAVLVVIIILIVAIVLGSKHRTKAKAAAVAAVTGGRRWFGLRTFT